MMDMNSGELQKNVLKLPLIGQKSAKAGHCPKVLNERSQKFSVY